MMMLGAIWLQVSSHVELVTLCVTIPNNLLLLYCIFTKSPKKFGNYKYLMAFFSYQSMWFSAITTFLNVNYYTFETSVSIFVRRNVLGLPEIGMEVLTSLACSSNSMMFVALSVQYIYRYFAMTKSPMLKLFYERKISIWYFGMISFSLFIGLIIFVCGVKMEKSRNDGFRESLLSTFDLPENGTLYYARMTYYTMDPNGAINLDLSSLGSIFLIMLAVFPVLIMAYCGIRTYRRISKATSQLSNHMKLQKELFQALLLQSIVPCVFLFLPSTVYFACPLFNIPLGILSNVPGITFVIYPVLDPLIVLYVIKNYRIYLFIPELICLSHKIEPKTDENRAKKDGTAARKSTKNQAPGHIQFHSITN